MDIQTNSINQNGCSVCKAGQENYTTFRPAHRSNAVFYQYDYRHIDGELFSTVAQTWEKCREKRDNWLQAKNYRRLVPSIQKKMQGNKRLTKGEMGYQIGLIEPYHAVAVSWDFFYEKK
jgi:hypothetical protein